MGKTMCVDTFLHLVEYFQYCNLTFSVIFAHISMCSSLPCGDFYFFSKLPHYHGDSCYLMGSFCVYAALYVWHFSSGFLGRGPDIIF